MVSGKFYTICRMALLGYAIFAVTACSSIPENDPEAAAEYRKINDPVEKANRYIFKFNQGVDNVVLKPITGIYRIFPKIIRNSVHNFFHNLKTPVILANDILQGEPVRAGNTLTRFVINTTIGLLGLIDAAKLLGLPEYEKEDYGQSLAKLGVGPGCYLVLPVLGPSTARDTAASLANFMGGDAWYNVTVKNDTQHFSDIDYYSSRVTAGVDFRAKNYDSIENLEKNSVDFYASVKSLYLQDRQQKILNSNGTIEAMNDSDWEEIEN